MRRFVQELKYFLYKDFIPVTKGLILAGVITLFLSLFYRPFFDLLSLSSATLSRYPWTIITYPLANQGISLIFAALWLWFTGGSLERTWGSLTYGIFLFLVTLVTGLLIMLVSWVFVPLPVKAAGFWLPLTSLTWAWAEIFRDRELLFWGLIPVKSQWLAWILAAMTFFSYSHYHFLLGAASLSGIGVVYLFCGRGPFSRGFRYWLWQRGFSVKGWTDRFRKKEKNHLRRVK